MKMFNEIEFANTPIMLAAWPGMGNVGIITVDYLRTKLKATQFIELDMSAYFIPDSIVVKDGLARFPEIPSAVFYYHKDPDLIIFESNAQVSGRDAITIIKTIIDVARQYGVKKIFTAAAFAQPVGFEKNPEVLAACNNPSLFDFLEKNDIHAMPDGFIAGMNGLLLGVAASYGIESCCFLGTIPSFASNLSYPKASREILKLLGRIVDETIDFGELEKSIEAVDEQLGAIEDRIKEFFPTVAEEEDELPEIDDDKVPEYIMEKIERLFDDVKNDHSKATKLKEELDRWKLYELYEHRFLDIFNDEEGKD